MGILWMTVLLLMNSLRGVTSLGFDWNYLDAEDEFEIKISSQHSEDATNRYVAIAFAKEPFMEDADGYYCSTSEIKSIVIQQRYSSPVVLESIELSERNRVSAADGWLNCTFIRPMRVKKTISSEVEYNFEFDSEPYNVLLASGPLRDGSLQHHDEKLALGKADFASGITDEINPIDGSLCQSDDAKNCVRYPSNCLLTDPQCMFFSVKQEGTRIVMEISGGEGNGNAYIAVAFADSQEMKDADLYFCDGLQLRSGVIRKREVRPAELYDTSVEVISAGTVNGVGQCIFSRSGCVTKEISGRIRKDFDLLDQSFFILLAGGNMTADGKMLYHGPDKRLATSGAVPLGQTTGTEYECEAVDLTPEVIDTSDCQAHFCFSHPEGCFTSSPDCLFVSIKQEGDSFHVEMSGSDGNGVEFVAVNFVPLDVENSDSREMYFCDGQRLTRVLQEGEDNEPDAVEYEYISNVTAETVNGIAHCSFTRPGCVTLMPSDNKLHSYDFFADEYKVQIASGDVTSNVNEPVEAIGAEKQMKEYVAEDYECVNGYDHTTTASTTTKEQATEAAEKTTTRKKITSKTTAVTATTSDGLTLLSNNILLIFLIAATLCML